MPQNVCRLSKMCVRGVWGVYEWLWILGGGMMCKQSINTQFDYFILAGSFSSSYLGLVKMYRLSGCLQGVWRVSGRRLELSEWLWILSGGYDVQAIDKHPIWHIFISLFLFSQLPKIGQNVPYFGVSVGCLEGVWEVSGGCLAHSGLCLGPIDAKSIAISPVEMINWV